MYNWTNHQNQIVGAHADNPCCGRFLFATHSARMKWCDPAEDTRTGGTAISEGGFGLASDGYVAGVLGALAASRSYRGQQPGLFLSEQPGQEGGNFSTFRTGSVQSFMSNPPIAGLRNERSAAAVAAVKPTAPSH